MRRSPSESLKTRTMSRQITAGLFMGSWDQTPGASRKETRGQATAMNAAGTQLLQGNIINRMPTARAQLARSLPFCSEALANATLAIACADLGDKSASRLVHRCRGRISIATCPKRRVNGCRSYLHDWAIASEDIIQTIARVGGTAVHLLGYSVPVILSIGRICAVSRRAVQNGR